jgi:hypothetical protein
MSSIVCSCKVCMNHDHEKRACKLKVVFIDEDGTCGDKELGDADAGTDEVAGDSGDDVIEQ